LVSEALGRLAAEAFHILGGIGGVGGEGEAVQVGEQQAVVGEAGALLLWSQTTSCSSSSTTNW